MNLHHDARQIAGTGGDGSRDLGGQRRASSKRDQADGYPHRCHHSCRSVSQQRRRKLILRFAPKCVFARPINGSRRRLQLLLLVLVPNISSYSIIKLLSQIYSTD